MPSNPSGASLTCKDCPSFVPPSESEAVWNVALEYATCHTHGHILSDFAEGASTPDGDLHVQAAFVKGCGEFGNVRRGYPSPDLKVSQSPTEVTIDLAARKPYDPVKTDPATRGLVRSCVSCAYYVNPEEMDDAFSINAGSCGARGLIIRAKASRELPKTCNFTTEQGRDTRLKNGVMASAETIKLNLIPVHVEAAITGRLAAQPAGAPTPSTTRTVAFVVDPSDYDSDAPVSAEDTARGIRAWRKFTNPTVSSKFTMMPVMDTSFFEDSERELIPQTGSDEHPEHYNDFRSHTFDLAASWALGQTPMLWGQSGVGKTELARHMAWLMQMPFARLSINQSTEADDLLGKWLLETDDQGNQATIWMDGSLVYRWTRPGVLLADEPNLGPNEVWGIFRPLTDNSTQLVLPNARNQRYDADALLKFCMACNPAYDPRYFTAQELAAPDSERLSHIWMDFPSIDVEKQIVFERVHNKLDADLSEDDLDFVMAVSTDIREMCSPENPELPMSWGIRSNIKVAMFLTMYSRRDAYKHAVADMLDPEHQKAILETVRGHGGDA